MRSWAAIKLESQNTVEIDCGMEPAVSPPTSPHSSSQSQTFHNRPVQALLKRACTKLVLAQNEPNVFSFVCHHGQAKHPI